MTPWRVLVAALTSALVWVMPAFASPAQYVATDIGAAPICLDLDTSIPGFSWAADLNNLADVSAVGTQTYGDCTGNFMPFSWKHAVRTGLEIYPAGSSSFATNALGFGVNDVDQVVGIAGFQSYFVFSAAFPHQPPEVPVRAFLDQGTQSLDLGTLNQQCAPCFMGAPGQAAALAINNAGLAVGVSTTGQTLGPNAYPLFHAASFQSGHVTDLGTLGGPQSVAFDVNNNGDVVGTSLTATSPPLPADPWSSLLYCPRSLGLCYRGLTDGHAFLYSNGVMTDLAPGSSFSSASGINDGGSVVGSADGHGFLYANGHTTDLGSFQPTGINKWDQALSSTSLYRDGSATDLAPLIPGTWSNVKLEALNDNGQILGTGNTQIYACPVPNHCGIDTVEHAVLLTDQSPPTCSLTGSGTNAQGQKYITVTTQDTLSGLKSITATKLTNATMTPPGWTVGTALPVTVTATKLNKALSSVIALQATDIGGNTVDCDPALLLTVRKTGAPETQTATRVPATERFVIAANDDPGVTTLAVAVNGRLQQILHLSAGERQTVDIGAALTARQNTVEVSARGKPGGSALVVVSDTAPNS